MQPPEDLLVEVTDQLNREWSDLGECAADAIFTQLPSYAGVDREDVHTAVATNIRRAISTLRSGHAPSARTRDEAAVTTRARADAGVPIEDIIRAYRLSLRVIHDRFLTLATERGIPAEQILNSSNLLWDVGDWFTAIAAAEYRHHAVRDAVRETMRQAELIRELVGGSLPSQRIRAAATALELDPAGRYSVFYVAPRDGSDSDRTRSALERLDDGRLVVAESAGRWVGLTADPPILQPPKHVVAVGPRGELADLPESARIADLIFEVARDEPNGTYTLEDVSWRLGTLAEPAVTRFLHAKYVQPVLERGEFGELLLESIRVLLRVDLNITRAAKELVVHPNTLRYRIGKYEEIVGASLSRTDTIVESAWALRLPPTHR